MSVRKISIAVVVLASFALTSCSNKRSNPSLWNTAYATLKPGPGVQAPDPQLVAQESAKALANISGPVALMSLERTKAIAVIRQIETNGAYRTWASSSGAERRSITTKHGMLTATRGLGFDLMSSRVEGVLALVRARREGQAQLIQRYLDGENKITEVVSNCAVARGASQQVVEGEINQSATQMSATCSSEKHRFINTYLVNAQGRILRAQQWHGPHFGQLILQQLR